MEPTYSSCRGLQPSTKAFMLIWPISGKFLFTGVTLITFSSKLSKFDKNFKNPKVNFFLEKNI